jgi:hypothetical protein
MPIQLFYTAQHACCQWGTKLCQIAFYLLEVDFLGHYISGCGIEPNSSKVEKILNWPVPKNATDVHAFLGLVQYVATFLPKLADHTTVLMPLTTKDTQKNFPLWMAAHQYSLDLIKALAVVSSDCLTAIVRFLLPAMPAVGAQVPF